MYLKDNEFFVRSGSIESGTWSLSSDMLSNGKVKIKISSITSCIIVKDEHSVSHTGAGRIAGGILGAALLGPIGALGGLLTGGKKKVDETIVHCGLDDNRSFTAESSQIGAANLVRITQQNVRSLNASNFQSQLKKVEADDEMDCPQCAEVIKRKAKICRFCNHIISASTPEASDTKNSLPVDISAPVIKGPKVEEIKKKQTSREKRAIAEENAKRADEAKTKPFTPSAALAAIVGATPLTRVEVVNKLWAYIKKHKLQDETNKRMINADAKLKEVLGEPQISMFDMAGQINKHLK